MATLTGKKIKNTYDALIKIEDNNTISSTPKQLTDGLGNATALYLSSTKLGIGTSPTEQFHTTGAAKIGGDLTVIGNLTVNGTTTHVDSTIVEIGDNMIELAKDNSANTKDIGWYGTINSGGEKYVGMKYDAGSGVVTPTFELGLTLNEPGNTADWSIKGKLIIGALDATGGTFSGQVTIPLTPTNNAHAASKKYVDDEIDALGEVDVAKRLEVTVKNVSGGSLAKGTVVHASPSATPPSGNVIEVIVADYDDATKMPAIGILNETIANEAEGAAVMMGAVSGINTNSFSAGDELYVGNDGALTNTKPTATTELVQKIAICVKVHGSQGSIKVFGAGRSNDVPNQIERNVNFTDNSKLTFGDSTTPDLEIYHDGSNSYVRDLGTGNLYLDTSGNQVIITTNATAKTAATFTNNGSVDLYYNNSKKFETTNTGINIIGGITGDDSVFIEGNTNPNFTAHDITNETYTSLWSGDSEAALTFNHSLFRITSSAYNFTGTDLLSISSSGVSTFYGSILPGTDSNHDLGSTTMRWENVWADNINGGTPVNGSGTANDVVMWSDSDTLTDAPIAISGNNATFAGSITAVNLSLETGSPILTLKDTTDNDDQKIQFMNSSGTVDYLIQTQDYTTGGGGDGLYLGSTNSNEVAIVTNNATRLTIDGSGNATFTGDVDIEGGLLTVGQGNNGENRIEIGKDRTTNGFAYIDLVGDATYTDFGLRIIRGSTGANAASTIEHRGTGNFNIKTTEAANLRLLTANTTALTLDSSQNATFTGTIASDRQTITSSSDNILTFDQTGGGWSYIEFESDGTRNFYVGQDSGENFIIGADSAKTFTFSNFSSLSFAAAQLNSTGNILPNVDSTYDLGNTTKYWRNIYADNIISNGGDAEFQKVYKDTVTINDSTYTTIATVNGNSLASAVRLNVSGVGSSSVINVDATILVNHYRDILIKSTCGYYRRLYIAVVSNNNEDFAIEIKKDTGGATSQDVNIEITPLNSEEITITNSHSYSSLYHVHLTEYGESQSSNDADNGHDYHYWLKDDGAKLKLGAGQDLQLYHDGSNSYINETGTGSLITQASDYFLRVGGTNNTNNAIVVANSGTVSLYYANSTKFQTLSDGAKVLGEFYIDEYITHTTDGNTKFGFPSADNFSVTTSGTERMRIDSSGRVGIGTNTPTAPLHIEGATNSEVLKVEADADPYIRWVENGTNVGFLQFTGGTAYLSNMANGSFQFRTNNTTKMLITSGGDVGIGTTSPLGILQLNVDSDHSIMRITAGDNSIAGIDFGKTSDIDDARIRYYNSGRYMQFFVANGERARINSSGQFLVETTTSQTTAKIGVRQNGSSIEFGHDNQSYGYYGTLGATYSSGYPFIAFACYNNSTIGGNNFATQGHKGNVIYHQNNGDLIFAQATTATSSSQGLTERMRLKNDGNFGIGTNSPSQKLDVAGIGQFAGAIRITETGTSQNILIGNQDSGGTNTPAMINGVNGNLRFGRGNSWSGEGGTFTEVVRISTNNNVGIGTTAPTYKLDVNGPTNSKGLRINGLHSFGAHSSQSIELNMASTSYSAIRGFQDTVSTGVIHFFGNSWSGGASVGMVNISGTNGVSIGAWNVASTSTTFLSSGNVGIGTSSPNAKLDILGASSDQLRLRTAETEEYKIGRNSSTGYLDFYGTQSSYTGYTFGGVNGERMRINSSGDIGIGTTPETAGPTWRTLFVGASLAFLSRQSASGYDSIIANNYYINSSNADKKRVTGTSSRIYLDGDVIRFQNSGSAAADSTVGWDERMRIAANGDVGIGTTSPSYKLQVQKTSNAAPAFMVGGAYYGGPRIQTYGLDADSNAWMGLGTDMSGAPYEHNIYFSDYNSMGRLSIGTYNGTTYSEKMCVLRTGNVGIGTSSPSEKVHIVQNTSDHLINLLEQDNASYEAWYEARGENGGLARFGISTNSNAYAFYNTSVNHYRWYHTAGGFLMKLDSNGRLGIGTTSIDTNVKLDVAGAGHFETNSNGRVLYLDAASNNGNIIQFHKQGTNKWEVVGRDGTFYVYKNDGYGSGYRWQIDSNGNQTLYGDVQIRNELHRKSNNNTTTLYSERNLEIPYQGASGYYDFDPVALFGANRSGGYVIIEVNGWQTRFNAGYIHWNNNGSGSGKIGSGSVTFRQTAWSGSASGAGITVQTVTSSADVIRVNFSGWHSNAHGWQAYIRYPR